MNRLLFVTIVAAVLSLVAAAKALMSASKQRELRVNDIVFVGPHQGQSIDCNPEHSYGPFWVCGVHPGSNKENPILRCVSGAGREYWIHPASIDWKRTDDRSLIALSKVKP